MGLIPSCRLQLRKSLSLYLRLRVGSVFAQPWKPPRRLALSRRSIWKCYIPMAASDGSPRVVARYATQAGRLSRFVGPPRTLQNASGSKSNFVKRTCGLMPWSAPPWTPSSPSTSSKALCCSMTPLRKCSAVPQSKPLERDINRFIPQRFRSEHPGHMRRFGETGVTNRAIGNLRGHCGGSERRARNFLSRHPFPR